MTQEEKEIFLKDLCGRLRSGFICSIYREDDEGFGWRDAECKGYFQNNDSYEFYFEDVITVDNIERMKPYLRPISSITEEEKKELYQNYCKEFSDIFNASSLTWELRCCVSNSFGIDWLNAHYFDYSGLIPMGLALEAPKGMYVIK